jgi:RNA polymerase sigma factor (sigma-70 family)
MTPLLAQGLRVDRSFERIYKRHVGDVYRYALAVLRNPADAEDVTQTTFLNAYRAYAGGERPRQAQNWLIAIAHNVCRQRFRQAQRRPQEVAFDENVGEWLENEDRGPSADDLRRALSHLAFNQRAALVMRELEGRSYLEIAEILGLTVAAVETLIFRARRAVREQLEGALTCAEAERALSLEADGELPRADKGPLRAHLRQCKECAVAARRQRAQRSAWKALGALPVPASLSSLFGGGGAALGVKAAAVAASAVAAGGIGFAGEQQLRLHHPAPAKQKPAARIVVRAKAPAAVVPARTFQTRVSAVVSHTVPAVAAKSHTTHTRRDGEDTTRATVDERVQAKSDESAKSGDGESRDNGHAQKKEQHPAGAKAQAGHDAEQSAPKPEDAKKNGQQAPPESKGQSDHGENGGDGHRKSDKKGSSDRLKLPRLPVQTPVSELPPGPATISSD